VLKKTIIVSVAVMLCAASAPQTLAQQSGDKTKPVTSHVDRTTADPATRKKMNEKLAAQRAKRNACIKESAAQKISLLKRNKFIKDCMAKS